MSGEGDDGRDAGVADGASRAAAARARASHGNRRMGGRVAPRVMVASYALEIRSRRAPVVYGARSRVPFFRQDPWERLCSGWAPCDGSGAADSLRAEGSARQGQGQRVCSILRGFFRPCLALCCVVPSFGRPACLCSPSRSCYLLSMLLLGVSVCLCSVLLR